MSLINKEIGEFTVQAYHEGAFKAVSKADVLGTWAVFFLSGCAGKVGRIFLLSGGLYLCLPHGAGRFGK